MDGIGRTNTIDACQGFEVCFVAPGNAVESVPFFYSVVIYLSRGRLVSVFNSDIATAGTGTYKQRTQHNFYQGDRKLNAEEKGHSSTQEGFMAAVCPHWQNALRSILVLRQR